ncbi:MAG: NADPH:quinone reductase [Intrasporangium sp.]|uniref:NADPH:quinone reductase n=1 Tax=Intrasporangium sp. TaxID=1925024 RepID=UPI002647A22F|nr:NADPH:quinone reductase [Intrasporangium sp.]MDN5796081.1 NADPH:quinone reductase [Intrasporangium sp.]
MRAAYITRLGGPDAIEVGELPDPAPGPGDVLVRVAYAPVNHVDTFVRSGGYPTPTPFPFVLGRDLVGTVVETGPGATGVEAGARVWCNSMGHGGRQGTFSELVAVPADRLYALPSQADPVSFVALVHPAATAYLGLFRHARLRLGETVVVMGAGGAVGSAVVQLAVRAGARVIALTSAHSAGWARECGAHVVLDHDDPALPGAVAAAAPDGVDVWWDNSAQGHLGMPLTRLALGGRLVVVAGLTTQAAFTLGQLYARDASLLGFVISNASVADLGEAARAIIAVAADGGLLLPSPHVRPLAEAAAAHAAVEEGGRRRQVISIDPPG